MKIKHSKYKNTGLIYELLVKQITADLIARKDSPAVNILRRYYSGEGPVVKEYRIYKTILEGTNLLTIRAENLINAAIRSAKSINLQELKKDKYNLISEIKGSYDLENFFSEPVANYKPLAAFYCLLEVERSHDVIDPQFIVNNKVTLLEYMTNRYQSKESVRDTLIEEYSACDKDLRLLTFKILLEKFNEKYDNLLPEQKNVLKQFITLGPTKKLKEFLNEEYSKIRGRLREIIKVFPSGVEKIKLQEAIKRLEPITDPVGVGDTHLVRLLQFYELLEELKKVG